MKTQPETRLAKAVRSKRGTMSYRDLGSILGIDHNSLHRIENGRMPLPRDFITIVAWLGEIDDATTARLRRFTND